VDGVEKFKIEKPERSPEQPWGVRAPAPEKRFLQDPSPRLVGGTSFDPNLALDQHQVLTLAEASLQSMEDARKVVRAWHRQGQSLADIYLLGLTPAARLLGERWLSDDMDFIHGTIAFSRLHQLLHEFSSEFLLEDASEANGLSLLLMTEPNSQHGMGAFMVSEFFRRAGWTVTLASPQDINDLKQIFQSDWFDAVMLSISSDRQLTALSQAIPELISNSLNPHLKIYVGGAMAHFAPEKLDWPGTRLLTEGALEAVDIVTQSVVTETASGASATTT
jgi:MerR family transcriptional regulator, light-induced transcriptional regulator